MHWTQALYVGLLVLACYTGKPRPAIMVAMWGDLIATMVLASSPIAVGVADAAAMAVLMMAGRRGLVVAMLFSVMIPVYVAAAWLAWPNEATYAIIDLIAYLQLGVIGGLDRGLRIAFRAFVGRNHGRFRAAKNGGNAGLGVARVSTLSRGAQN